MTDDILADLEAKPKKRPGVVCRVETMRRQRPELVPQWETVLEAKRTGALDRSDADIAGWFADHGFPIGYIVVARHRKNECELCREMAA